MMFPNESTVVIGKADKVEQLPIPEWARASFAPSKPVGNPLDVYAGGANWAFGFARAQGKRVWPWRRQRMRSGGQQLFQGQKLAMGRAYE